MRLQCRNTTWNIVLSSIALSACALPSIQHENARKTPDAGDVDARQAEPLDPMMDPANRDEDFATFRTLLPRDHIYAGWPMPDNSPGAAVRPDYSVSERVITDNVTQLRWQRLLPKKYPGCMGRYPLRGDLQDEGTGCTWEEARAWCGRPEVEEDLGPGHWRLPTKIELESLLDVTSMPAFDPVFETYPTDFFWTASPYPNPDSVKLAWAVDFSEGYSYGSGRYKAGRVRCVASPDESIGRAPDYELTKEWVGDRSTKLTWQALPDSGARTWEQSVDYCKNLKLSGGGWRLPFLKELLTIVDSSQHLPAVVRRAFPNTPDARFWTASKVMASEEQAFQVDFAKGGVEYSSIDDELFTRCVR